jgi:hypothetical protein
MSILWWFEGLEKFSEMFLLGSYLLAWPRRTSRTWASCESATTIELCAQKAWSPPATSARWDAYLHFCGQIGVRFGLKACRERAITGISLTSSGSAAG